MLTQVNAGQRAVSKACKTVMGIGVWRNSVMWQRLPRFIREWPILICGILLIAPVLYFLSFESSSSKSTASAPSLNRLGEPASRPMAADALASNAEPSSRSARTLTKTVPNSAQVPSKPPAMSHGASIHPGLALPRQRRRFAYGKSPREII